MGNEPTCPYEEGHIIKDCPVQLAYEEQKARADELEVRLRHFPNSESFVSMYVFDRMKQRADKAEAKLKEISDAWANEGLGLHLDEDVVSYTKRRIKEYAQMKEAKK